MFSTIEAAIDYLKSKLQDFYSRRFEIDDLYQQARVNLQEAYSQNRMVDEAQASLQEAIQLVNDHHDLADRLRPLASAFDVDTGLGVFPAAVITAIWYLGGVAATITVAELLWGYYQRLEQQRVIIDQVKKGLLPASVLTRPPTAGPIERLTSNVMMLGLLGFGGWLLIKGKL